MKKRLGILALAAALIVQSAAFVPAFAADSADEPTVTEETVLARYKSSDTIKDVWATSKTTPWALYAQVYSQGRKDFINGRDIDKNVYGGVTTNYKAGVVQVGWHETTVGGCNQALVALKNDGKGDLANDPFVSGALMSTGTLQNVINLAKGFTAPESGIIKIGSYFKEGNNVHENGIVGSIPAQDAGAVRARIVSSKGNEILPYIKFANGEEGMTEGYGKNSNKALVYTYSDTYIIEKGETLYFEVSNADDKVRSGASYISWDPIVEYVAYQPEYSEITYDRNGASFTITNDPGITADNVFVMYKEDGESKKEKTVNFVNNNGYITFDFATPLKSGIEYSVWVLKTITAAGMNIPGSHTYSGLKIEAAKNSFEPVQYKDKDGNDRWVNDDVWGAYYRIWGSESALMESEIPFWSGTPTVDIQGQNVYLANLMSKDQTSWVAAPNGDFIPFIGAKLMSCGAGTYGNQGYSVSKGFTAPYSGNVKIEQNNILDTTVKNEIWSSSDDQEGGNGLKIRITKNTKDNVVMDYVNLDKTNGGRYEFTPFEVYVNKGDILYFEVTTKNSGYTQPYKSFVHWNPVVTYTDVAIDASFIDSSGNAITTVDGLLAADGAQLKMSAFDAAEDAAGIPVIVFKDENGALVKTVIANTVNLEAVSGNTTIQLGDLSGINAKSVKAMLWAADGTLKPLTGIFAELKLANGKQKTA